MNEEELLKLISEVDKVVRQVIPDPTAYSSYDDLPDSIKTELQMALKGVDDHLIVDRVESRLSFDYE